MKLISIESWHTENPKTWVINANQITYLDIDDGAVVIRLNCGAVLRTKFTDIGHAVDYIQRAPSYSFTGGK